MEGGSEITATADTIPLYWELQLLFQSSSELATSKNKVLRFCVITDNVFEIVYTNVTEYIATTKHANTK